MAEEDQVKGDCLKVVRVTAFEIDKYYVTWTLPNFACLQKQGKRLRSRCFNASCGFKHKWLLQLYPRGYKEHPKDEIGIFLLLLACDYTEMEVRLRVGVLDKCDNEIYVTSGCSSFEKNRGWGFPKVFTKDDLCANHKCILKDGALTVFVEFTAALVKMECSEDMEDEELKVLEQVGGLLDCEKFADTAVESASKTFKAHKAILSARSPAFARIFCRDPCATVDLSCFEEEVVKMFLKYIYKGELRNIDPYANLLLDLGCQFCIDDLKMVCLKILYKKLNSKNCLTMLTIANDFVCKELKNAVMDYMAQFPNVIRAKPWECLGPSETDLALELTSTILNKTIDKKKKTTDCPKRVAL